MSNIILTVAVPAYNAAIYLEKNLRTYCAEQLRGRLEVIVLSDACTDNTNEVIAKYVAAWPEVFRLYERQRRGYGSAINEAIENLTNGKYFRIVDADDCVDTEELIKLVDKLESCEADIIQTDYRVFNIKTGKQTIIRASTKGIQYGVLFTECIPCINSLLMMPSLHSTTYRVSLLRDNHYQMKDNRFFVDEEYVTTPFLMAKNVIFFPYEVYQYQVANPSQSMSPRNRAKYFLHREANLKEMICIYLNAEKNQKISENNLLYCRIRVQNAIADHFTTLYMYISNRKEGRKLAFEWKSYILKNCLSFWPNIRKKVTLLFVLNILHISLKQYKVIKKIFLSTKEIC